MGRSVRRTLLTPNVRAERPAATARRKKRSRSPAGPLERERGGMVLNGWSNGSNGESVMYRQSRWLSGIVTKNPNPAILDSPLPDGSRTALYTTPRCSKPRPGTAATNGFPSL